MLEIAAAMIALSMWLWFRRPQVVHSPTQASIVSEEQLLHQLIAETTVSINFAATLEVYSSDVQRLSQSLREKLDTVRTLENQFGLSPVRLLRAVQVMEDQNRKVVREWEKQSSAAYTTSLTMLFLPLGMLTMSEGLGVHAVNWLLTTPFGWLATLVGLGLSIGARTSLQLLKRRALQVEGRTRFTIDRRFAAFSAASAVVSFLSTALGIVLSVVTFFVVYRMWPSLQPQHKLNTTRRIRNEIPWLLEIIRSSLEAGFDWKRSVDIASECATEEQSRNELTAMARKLSLGVDPTHVFSQSRTEWREVAPLLGRAITVGAPVADALSASADSFLRTMEYERVQRVQSTAALTPLPVSLFQIPAFILLGLVPSVMAHVLPLLEMFSSTGVSR